jgi:hypothetical protein
MPCGDVVVGQPFAGQSHHIAFGGVGDADPLAGFAFAAPKLGVGDGLLGGQGRALGPHAFKVLRADGIAECCH